MFFLLFYCSNNKIKLQKCTYSSDLENSNKWKYLAEKKLDGDDQSRLSFPNYYFNREAKSFVSFVSFVSFIYIFDAQENLSFLPDVSPTDGPSAENSPSTMKTVTLPAKETSSESTNVPLSTSKEFSLEAAASSTADTTGIDSGAMSRVEKPRGKLSKSHSVSTGTSPPPQSISTQVRLEVITYDCQILPNL